MALLEPNQAARLAVLHQLLRRAWASLPDKSVAVTVPVVSSASEACAAVPTDAPQDRPYTSAAALRLLTALDVNQLTVNLQMVAVTGPPDAATRPRLLAVLGGTGTTFRASYAAAALSPASGSTLWAEASTLQTATTLLLLRPQAYRDGHMAITMQGTQTCCMTFFRRSSLSRSESCELIVTGVLVTHMRVN